MRGAPGMILRMQIQLVLDAFCFRLQSDDQVAAFQVVECQLICLALVTLHVGSLLRDKSLLTQSRQNRFCHIEPDLGSQYRTPGLGNHLWNSLLKPRKLVLQEIRQMLFVQSLRRLFQVCLYRNQGLLEARPPAF